MTDPAIPTDPSEGQGEPDPAANDSGTYTPPQTQAELDRIIAERVNRTKAQFKDYKDLQAQAAELAQIKQSQLSEAERLTEEATRWQTEAEQWRTAAVGSTITALAATDFADPSDAAAALSDPAKYLDAGGVINEAAIRADLTALLEAKPHWRRQEGTPVPRIPAPNHAQGSSAAGAAASDPATQFGAILQGQLNGSR